MPHFFLMNKEETKTIEEKLQRSRIHYSAGITLVEHDKLVHGIATLYDALEYGISWYLEHNRHVDSVPHDFQEMVQLLSNYVNWDRSIFDPLLFQELMEKVIDNEEMGSINPDQILKSMNYMFELLDIIPFDLEVTPEEDPETRKILGI